MQSLKWNLNSQCLGIIFDYHLNNPISDRSSLLVFVLEPGAFCLGL